MATLAACRKALKQMAHALAGADDKTRSHALDRTVSCHIPDLDVTFWGRLDDGELKEITTTQPERAQIRLTVHSDDLVELAEGRLSFAPAWASGRLKLDASFRDLLKLRSLL